jgi:ribosomal protein S3
MQAVDTAAAAAGCRMQISGKVAGQKQARDNDGRSSRKR